MVSNDELSPAAVLVRAAGAFLRDLVADPQTSDALIAAIDRAEACSIALEVRPVLQVVVQGRGPAGEFSHRFPITIIPPRGGLNS